MDGIELPGHSNGSTVGSPSMPEGPAAEASSSHNPSYRRVSPADVPFPPTKTPGRRGKRGRGKAKGTPDGGRSAKRAKKGSALGDLQYATQGTETPSEALGEVEEPELADNWTYIRCGWEDCRQAFWILEDLLEHVHGEAGGELGRTTARSSSDDALAGHVPPVTMKGQKFACEWLGCTKRGAPQGSRQTLVVHLRTHTTEKAFPCPKHGEPRERR